MEEDHDCEQVVQRISFSDNLSEADCSSLESKRVDRNLPLNQTLSDFDFSVSLDSSSARDMRHADELFSNGKILSIPIRSSSPATVPPLLKSSDTSKVYSATRSSSLNVSSSRSSRNSTFASAFASPFLLPRSGSEASQTSLILKRHQKSNNNNCNRSSVISHNFVRDVNAKKYGFSGSMSESYVRSPVPFRPKERNCPRLTSYFMCSCMHGA